LISVIALTVSLASISMNHFNINADCIKLRFAILVLSFQF